MRLIRFIFGIAIPAASMACAAEMVGADDPEIRALVQQPAFADRAEPIADGEENGSKDTTGKPLSAPPTRGGHDAEWNQVFRYASQGGGDWNGGDGAMSVELPSITIDGTEYRRTFWLFGDSWRGDVVEGRRQHNPGSDVYGNSMAIQYQAVHPSVDPDDPGAIGYRDWGARYPSHEDNPRNRIAHDSWIPLALHQDIEHSAIEGLQHADSLKNALSEFSQGEEKARIALWGKQGIVIGNDLLLFFSPMTLFEMMRWKQHEGIAVVVRGVDRPVSEWGHQQFSASWSDSQAPRQAVIRHSHTSPHPDDPSGRWWGSYIMKDPDDQTTVYIYGFESDQTGVDQAAMLEARPRILIARVQGVHRADDILEFDRWQFFNHQQGWIDDPNQASAIIEMDCYNVYNSFSISRSKQIDNRYVLVTNRGMVLHQTGDAPEILVRTAPRPEGPWTDKYILDPDHCPGEPGEGPVTRSNGQQWPWYGNATYAVRAHPEHSNDDTMLVSYIASYIFTDDEPVDPAPYYYYVPRFIRIPWSEIRDHSQSDPARCRAWSAD
jgi:hypothetical protein